MLHYYCPHCWKEIEAGAIQCPHCLYALADHERLSYEEKLLRALGHPIRENRMLAIQLLGELKSTAALPTFETLLRDEEDPYVVREVARAVARIGGDEGRGMLRRLEAHRATIVRNAAEVFLGESAGAGPQDHPSVGSSRSLDQGGGERVPAGAVGPMAGVSTRPDAEEARGTMGQHADSTRVTGGISRRAALQFVVLLGVVSLFADMTYEGARSITGPYLAALGASGAAVGLVAGLGELVGYALRLASGYAADRSRRYWAITMVGYGLNLAAVPLLALAGRWEMAAVLMIAERVGKAVRTPARDAMLSHATHEVGHGWGFGLHEALDQAGAVLGPLVVAAVLFAGGGYRTGFGILLVPALLALGVLTAAWRLYPRPRDLEVSTPETADSEGFPRAFWLYLAAAAAIAAGYADFPLIAYHFGKRSVVAPDWIPVFYAVAMGVDALAALLFGPLFDRHGLSVLIASTLLSAPFAPLAFLGGPSLALLGIALWGIGMGAQESILRAAIAAMIPPGRRGSAYGLFNAGYGLAWFAGSALMGFFYDVSLTALVTFSVATQLTALPLLLLVALQDNRPRTR